MADIRKTFNFRAGVQVDDDVFIVRGEQVGIGTTIPTESLDVRGNAKVVGILTAQNTDFSAGISTFGDVKIGTGISISASSGIITATTFSGDGSLLQNVPTSAWVQYNQLDDNGLSVVSIAKTTGNVGIATTGASSNNDLQIGSDPQDGFSKGVGIGSDGNIYASGIITATTFRGALVGTVATVTSTQGNFSDHVSVGNTISIGGTVGLGSHVYFGDESRAFFGDSSDLQVYHTGTNSVIQNNTGVLYISGDDVRIVNNSINESGIKFTANGIVEILNNNSTKFETASSGVNITGITTTDDLNVSGVSTFTGNIDANGDLDVDGLTNLDDVSVAGVSTFTGSIDANGDLDVDGFTNLDGASIDGNLNVSGVSTFTGSIDANGDLDVDGHTELDNVNVSGVVTATSFIGNITGTVNTAAQPNITSLGTITGLDVNGHSELDNVNVSGVSTFTGSIDANGDLDVDGHTELDNVNVSGLSTFTGAIDANGDLDVDGHTELDNVNVSGVSTFVGNSKFDGLLGIQTADPQTQLHVWDSDSQVARFQSNQTTSIISFVDETSTITPYIGANSNDLILGSISGGERLRITGIGGSLGIGQTNPEQTLHVVGTSTVTGNAFFGGNVNIDGNLTLLNNLSVGSLTVPSLNAHIIGNNAKIHSTSGISTFKHLDVTGVSTFSGNLTITNGNTFQVNDGSDRFFVSASGKVGIKTGSGDSDVTISGDTHFKTSVSVGSTARCAIDFSEVRDIKYNDGSDRSVVAYMLPPIFSTAQRNALVDRRTFGNPVVNGAIGFNSTTNRLEVAVGAATSTSGQTTRWVGIGSDHVSVKDFGAVGNGSADDTVAIQAAVDELNARAALTPATLSFPAGTYKITAPIDFSLDASSGTPYRREIVGGEGGGMPVARILMDYPGYGNTAWNTNNNYNPGDIVSTAGIGSMIHGYSYKATTSIGSTAGQPIHIHGTNSDGWQCISAGAFYFGPENLLDQTGVSTAKNSSEFGLSGFIFQSANPSIRNSPAIEIKGGAQSRIDNVTITSISNVALSLDSPQNTKLFNVSVWNSGRSFKYKDTGFITADQTGTTLTSVGIGTTVSASLFTTNDVGKNIALWGSNNFRRKTKIVGFTSATQVTVEDTAGDAFSGKNIIFGSPFITTIAGNTTITADADTFSSTDLGLIIWLKFTGHVSGEHCLIRRRITQVLSNTQVKIDTAPLRSTAGIGTTTGVKCEIATPSIELLSDHAIGNSSDNKFINLQIESHNGVGICAENQSILDFLNTKIHAEQGTNNKLSNVTDYSVSCMWLIQVDGSYLGKFEGQYIGRNKLWITGQTSSYTLLNLLAGSAKFERIIGVEKKHPNYDGAALVISGMQVNGAFPTHGLQEVVEDANLVNHSGFLMSGPFINQGSATSKEMTGHITQNAFVEELGTSTRFFMKDSVGISTYGNPTGGIYIFSEGGVLKYRQADGTVKTITTS